MENIKFKISYFYNIRFFNKNQIPISTALFDPKWYHDFKDKNNIFIDKRGVINGIRFELFNPQTSECTNCEVKDPTKCLFMKHYKEYIFSLNFNDVTSYLKDYASSIMSNMGIIDTPEIILIVHETPSNKCSEREILKEWFNENNVTLEEFSK